MHQRKSTAAGLHGHCMCTTTNPIQLPQWRPWPKNTTSRPFHSPLQRAEVDACLAGCQQGRKAAPPLSIKPPPCLLPFADQMPPSPPMPCITPLNFLNCLNPHCMSEPSEPKWAGPGWCCMLLWATLGVGQRMPGMGNKLTPHLST